MGRSDPHCVENLEVLAVPEVLGKGQFDVHAIDFVRRNPKGEFVGRLASGGHRVGEGERALVLRSVEDVVVVLPLPSVASMFARVISISELESFLTVIVTTAMSPSDDSAPEAYVARCAGTDLHGRGDVVSDCDFAALCGGGLAAVGPLARVDRIGRGRL
jgi:hypothetical protein